ncbi:MAG: Holliday junction resolvase RuvX [Akkermansia sp.]|nr:Holliday junction resolvase RuvX [Akkermansia sp.]
MPNMHPALGIDYGQARIGIAATDPCGILAHPVESIHLAKTEPLNRIAELVEQKGIRSLVLGLPLRLDGTEGSACEKVRAFGKKLREKFPELPLIYVDEFLTTTVAQEKLHKVGKKAKDFKPIIDQAAAVEILNTWLEQTMPPEPDFDF